MNNEEPTVRRSWTDILSDLLSGRIHNKLLLLGNKLTEIMNKMTSNEQALNNAAEQINIFANNNESALNQLTMAARGIEDKIDRLTQQAQSAEPHETEDLTDELNNLNQAIGRLTQTNMALNSTAEVFRDLAGGQTVATDSEESVEPIHTDVPMVPSIPVGQPGEDVPAPGTLDLPPTAPADVPEEPQNQDPINPPVDPTASEDESINIPAEPTEPIIPPTEPANPAVPEPEEEDDDPEPMLDEDPEEDEDEFDELDEDELDELEEDRDDFVDDVETETFDQHPTTPDEGVGPMKEPGESFEQAEPEIDPTSVGQSTRSGDVDSEVYEQAKANGTINEIPADDNTSVPVSDPSPVVSETPAVESTGDNSGAEKEADDFDQ